MLFPPTVAGLVVAETDPTDIVEVQGSSVDVVSHGFQRLRQEGLYRRPQFGGNGTGD